MNLISGAGILHRGQSKICFAFEILPKNDEV